MASLADELVLDALPDDTQLVIRRLLDSERIRAFRKGWVQGQMAAHNIVYNYPSDYTILRELGDPNV